MNKMPLVSVVVPTYNRYKYLKECISSMLTIQSDELEFVIQDNTEKNDEILSYLESIADNRIKYYHEKNHISVVDNCDLAVKHSTGKFVCMIGDDDTICSSILKAASFCDIYGYESCCFLFPGFNWYDMTFESKKVEANLFFKYEANGSTDLVDAKKELLEAAKWGGCLSSRMPRLYHGLVAKKCLDRIYQKVGTYFPGPSPDMANGTAVCLETRSTVFISDYLIVSGYGHNSARGEGNRGQHYGKLDEKPWLPKDILQRWDKDLPAIFSAETIIAQSMIEALKRFKAFDYFKSFDYGKLYARFWCHHRDASKKMLSFCIRRPMRIVKFFLALNKLRVERKEYFKNPVSLKNYMEFNSVKTLTEAKLITEEQCAKIKEYYSKS